MSVKSVVGNFTQDVGDRISGFLHSTGTQIENITGALGTSIPHFWDGGFVGMSEAGKTELKTNLANYCKSVQDTMSKFDAYGAVSSAIKGTKVDEALHQYLASMKTLLDAYVSTMKQEIAELDEAYENFVGVTQTSIAKDVEGMSKDVASTAKNILDETDKIKLD